MESIKNNAEPIENNMESKENNYIDNIIMETIECENLDKTKLYCLWQDAIKTIKEEYGLTFDSTVRGLMKCGWNVETFSNKFINDVFFMSDIETKEINESKNKCEICYSEFANIENKNTNENKEEKYKLECGHEFCKSCMRDYLNNELETKGKNAVYSTCPNGDCKTIITENVMKDVVKMEEYNKWIKYMNMIFIDTSPQYKLCLNNNCDNVMIMPEKIKTKIANVQCECGKMRCNKCDNIAHCPMTCEYFSKWESLADIASKTWLLVNTRKCPKCCNIIYRDKDIVGCNHITCVCNYSFCWECGENWKIHINRTKDNFECDLKKEVEVYDTDRYNLYRDEYDKIMNTTKFNPKIMNEVLMKLFEVYGEVDQFDNTLINKTIKLITRIKTFIANTVAFKYFIDFNDINETFKEDDEENKSNKENNENNEENNEEKYDAIKTLTMLKINKLEKILMILDGSEGDNINDKINDIVAYTEVNPQELQKEITILASKIAEIDMDKYTEIFKKVRIGDLEKSGSDIKKVKSKEKKNWWRCEYCTLVNPMTKLRCNVCDKLNQSQIEGMGNMSLIRNIINNIATNMEMDFPIGLDVLNMIQHMSNIALNDNQ